MTIRGPLKTTAQNPLDAIDELYDRDNQRAPTNVSSATYTWLSADYRVKFDSSNNPIVLTIPTSLISIVGREFKFKQAAGDASVNNVTILPESGTIDGDNSVVIRVSGVAFTLVSDGINLFME